MKHIDFYLDFISPYAYLAFEQLPKALEGLSYSVAYKPVFLGAMLKHHGQLGPAEIPAKREWTYRQVLWLGHSHGIPIDMPATHPFNPLAHLRLALATSPDGNISRYVAETIFREVWRGGEEAGDAGRLAALASRLELRREPGGDAVKAQLKANTDEAIARGAFGVPAYAVDGRLIWGFDSLPMLRAALLDDPWFDSPQWLRAAERPSLHRPRP
ncbi:2-hydroxychromene-2-carboxylate isomerase [Variovorax rhizosphaerae]|uniref:2-hydroxychromene-2-carboxylate isomerase n=1 Tax=Variovorax rhizosphaerae TaxID=1836200 RepID=A0ABU8WI26_9BURK